MKGTEGREGSIGFQVVRSTIMIDPSVGMAASKMIPVAEEVTVEVLRMTDDMREESEGATVIRGVAHPTEMTKGRGIAAEIGDGKIT